MHIHKMESLILIFWEFLRSDWLAVYKYKLHSGQKSRPIYSFWLKPSSPSYDLI